MAQFIKLPISSLIKLPSTMTANIGALIEPLAVAVHGVGRTNLQGARVVVVLGAGPIGLLTALAVQAQGVQNVIISDIVPARLKLAASLGLSPSQAGVELLDRVMKLSGGDGADALFECAGHPSSALEMTSLVRSRGVIVNLGVFKRPVEVDMQALNFKELELIGSRVYERKDFSDAIELAQTLPLARVISHEFSLGEVRLAFDQFQSAGACKVLIRPTQQSQ